MPLGLQEGYDFLYEVALQKDAFWGEGTAGGAGLAQLAR